MKDLLFKSAAIIAATFRQILSQNQSMRIFQTAKEITKKKYLFVITAKTIKSPSVWKTFYYRAYFGNKISEMKHDTHLPVTSVKCIGGGTGKIKAD